MYMYICILTPLVMMMAMLVMAMTMPSCNFQTTGSHGMDLSTHGTM